MLGGGGGVVRLGIRGRLFTRRWMGLWALEQAPLGSGYGGLSYRSSGSVRTTPSEILVVVVCFL